MNPERFVPALLACVPAARSLSADTTQAEDSSALSGAVQRKLGRVQATEMSQARTTVATGGTPSVLGYPTKSAEGPAHETSTFRRNDTKPLLVCRDVNSQLQVTK